MSLLITSNAMPRRQVVLPSDYVCETCQTQGIVPKTNVHMHGTDNVQWYDI